MERKKCRYGEESLPCKELEKDMCKYDQCICEFRHSEKKSEKTIEEKVQELADKAHAIIEHSFEGIESATNAVREATKEWLAGNGVPNKTIVALDEYLKERFKAYFGGKR